VTSAVGPRQHVDQLVHFAPLLAPVPLVIGVLDTMADMILQDLLLDRRSAARTAAICVMMSIQ